VQLDERGAQSRERFGRGLDDEQALLVAPDLAFPAVG
jgi:hypothetical protein